MNIRSIMKQIKYIYKLIMSYFPAKLPVGLTAMHKFCDDVIELSGKFADIDSMKFAIATTIIHLDQGSAYVSKQFFVRRMRKAAANQVASAIFQEVKKRQDEEKAKAEATAKTQVLDIASNGKTSK